MPSTAPKQTRQRRAHTKSRLGCDVCKRRRIKCDESFPQCSRCIINRSECSYKSFTPAQTMDFLQKKYFDLLPALQPVLTLHELTDVPSMTDSYPPSTVLTSPRSDFSPVITNTLPTLFTHCQHPVPPFDWELDMTHQPETIDLLADWETYRWIHVLN